MTEMEKESACVEAETESPVSGHAAGRFLSPLALRDFRLLWTGETVSIAGTQLHMVALPWLVLQSTGSGLALGTVLMVAAAPRALLMLLSGVATDRYSPRSIMIGSNLARGAVVAVLVLLVAADSLRLWQLYAIVLVFGAADAFFYPAFSAIVPRLVDAKRLSSANALLQGSAQMAALIVPAAGGILISATGTAPAFAADTASFFFAAALLTKLQHGGRMQKAGQSMPSVSVLRELREGFVYAWRDPVVRGLLLVAAGLNFVFVGPFVVGTAALADREFGGAPALGLMYSALGGGALGGSVLAGSLRRTPPRGGLILGLLLVVGAGLCLLSFASSAVEAAGVIAVVGVMAGFSNVLIITLLQGRSDQAMLGRVMSLVMFNAVGLTPFSYALAGAAVDLGTTPMFLGAAVLLIPFFALSAWNRELRNLR